MVLIIIPLLSSASEITGYISTNPDNKPVKTEESGDRSAVDANKSTGGGGLPAAKLGGSFDLGIKKIQVDENSEVAGGVLDKPVVKGISFYKAGTLFRDSLLRVYVFDGKRKKHLKNLEELQGYSGQAIIDLPDQELALYPTKICLEGDLFRKEGSNEVYVIKNGNCYHVKSLGELKEQYAGQKIYNIENKNWSKIF